MRVNSGGVPAFSGLIRLMQRPELMQWTEVDGDRVRVCRGVMRWNRKTRRQGGKGPLSLFIRGWIQGMRGNRGGQNHHVAIWTPRFSGWLLR